MLLTRDRKRAFEICFRFRRILLGRLECDFPSDAMHIGLAPPLLGGFHRPYRFANAAPSIIELVELATESNLLGRPTALIEA